VRAAAAIVAVMLGVVFGLMTLIRMTPPWLSQRDRSLDCTQNLYPKSACGQRWLWS
jgi:hypothetical protein